MHQQIEALFDATWELSPAARAQILNERCADNLALRQVVEQLLASADELERNTAWNQPALVHEALQPHAALLDRYHLLETIGSGGMGIVYKAVRADDVFSKFVAIKIVQCGLADDAVLRRFVQERQILALLEHPGIARLLDGGTTPEGLPFLVMEFVDGDTMDRYLARAKPDLRRRLDLMRKICSAVAYAHRNLIVHRDLKPGNILVTAAGEPKLLDFGIAKLLDSSAARTRTEHAAMTPEYASPEQIQGAPITTASDVYSLGVLLHEMLTGQRPYRQTNGALELAQAIATDQPRTLQGSAGRPFDPDLETIVQKALRKEPARRYVSVDELAEDLRRYQEGYPVSARPDTRGYRLRKFIGRNRPAVLVATLMLLALLGGSAALWRQAQIAEGRFSDVRHLANSYLFEFHDAIKDLPGATAARQLVVKRAIEFLDKLADERSRDVSLGREVAAAYDKIAEIQGSENAAGLADAKAALRSYQRALSIRKSLSAASPSNPDVARELALSYAEVGWQLASTGEPSAGVELLRLSLAGAEKLVAARPNDPLMREALAQSSSSLADVLGNTSNQNLGDSQGALELYRRSLAIREKLVAEDPRNNAQLELLAVSHGLLAQMLQSLNDKPAAVGHFRQSADVFDEMLRRQPGNADFQRSAATANRNLAMSLMKINALSEARHRGDRSMAIFERIARQDPANKQAQVGLADSYYAQGFIRAGAEDNHAAQNFYESAIDIQEALAAEHPDETPPLGLRTAYQLLADLNIKTGHPVEAVANAQHELAIDARLLKADPRNAGAERNQGLALRQIAQAHEWIGMRKELPRQKRVAELNEATSWYRRSLAIFQAQQAKGTLVPTYASELDKTPKAIAKCDATVVTLAKP
ncbi:MAG: serine/threonine-protein kinase [Acidobacteria bacterium]|nr:serine/threonine-protein kinase [Acidobacteriota bacterium]